MNLQVKEIRDKKTWEEFSRRFSNYTFMSSWSWGEVERKIGNKIIRLGLFDGRKLEGICLLVVIFSKRGKYGYCPHPVVVKNNLKNKLSVLLARLKEIGKEEKLSFIRLGTLLPAGKEMIFKDLGLVKSPTHIYTDNFLVLDLGKSEDELLGSMRKTTRNLIRRAKKDGVEVRKIKDVKRVKDFYNLLAKTAKRHHFVPYSYNFLKSEFEVFFEDDRILLFEGWYKGGFLGSAMVVFYGDSGFYHHGASVLTKVPVSYLIQWEAIKEAKRRNKKYYNFWGFAPDGNKRHPFYGITKFKKGFGPEEVIFAPNYDLVIRKTYRFDYIIDIIRKIKRGH